MQISFSTASLMITTRPRAKCRSTYHSELDRRVNERRSEEQYKNVQCSHRQTQVQEGLPTVPEEREGMGRVAAALPRQGKKEVIYSRDVLGRLSRGCFSSGNISGFCFFAMFLCMA